MIEQRIIVARRIARCGARTTPEHLRTEDRNSFYSGFKKSDGPDGFIANNFNNFKLILVIAKFTRVVNHANL
jgi:hypothetical protein